MHLGSALYKRQDDRTLCLIKLACLFRSMESDPRTWRSLAGTAPPGDLNLTLQSFAMPCKNPYKLRRLSKKADRQTDQ